MDLHVSFTPDEDGWVMAQVEEIPEVITCAPTQAEASEMIREALGEWLALLKTGKALDAPDGQRETLRLLVS